MKSNALAFLVSFALTSCVYGISPTLKLGDTRIVGRSFPTLKQDFFGGIPFAETPTGNLRFQPPVPLNDLSSKSTNGIFDASKFGPACLQPVDDMFMSEDCLTINIFRPTYLSPHAKLPVMAYIYGGGFAGGASSIYNGSNLVAQSVSRGTPIIYVNFNYRLGPLGWPQGVEAGSRGVLNLGSKDQLLALQWIQQNIGSFGGDKDKVTLFGESAGAVSIAVLYFNSNLEKLIRGAIFESGSASSIAMYDASKPLREANWKNFVSAIPSCASVANTRDTIPCMQKVSTNADAVFKNAIAVALAAGREQFNWPPIIDGPDGIIPDFPSKLFAKGQFSKVPFITGANLDEGTMFTDQTLNYTSELIRSNIIANFTPPAPGVTQDDLEKAADRLLELYPDIPALGSPYGTGNETFGLDSGYKRSASLYGDMVFQALRRAWNEVASNADLKSFAYLFTDPLAGPPLGLPPSYGVAHTTEVPYVYGNLTSAYTPSAHNLSNIMMDYWISFVTNLDPNDGKGSQRPKWPQYTTEQPVLMQLNGQNTTVVPDDYRKEQIDFLNTNSIIFRH